MLNEFLGVGEWHKLDDKHLLKFLKGGSGVVGAALKHKVWGTDAWCEPGLIQWEPYGQIRPLFTTVSSKGHPISLEPKVVCEICGDSGKIVEGQWKSEPTIVGEPKEPMKVLDVVEWDDNVDDEADIGYANPEVAFQIATRRDLGDEVPEEEVDADRKIYDFFSSAASALGVGNTNYAPDDASLIYPEGEVPLSLEEIMSPDAPTTEDNKFGGRQSDIPVRFDLIDGKAMFEMAKVLDHGARKYGVGNWRSIDVPDHLNHLLAHTFAWLAGDKTDDHLSHILCRATFAVGIAQQGGPIKYENKEEE